jgi:hypothetical protein
VEGRTGSGGVAEAEAALEPLTLTEEERIDVGVGPELGQVGGFLAYSGVRNNTLSGK